jgi:hypothetical protein
LSSALAAFAFSGDVELPGSAVSVGFGQPVTARLSYGRCSLDQGCLSASQRFSEDPQAAGLLLAFGGRFSPAAVFSRSRRIPALVLESAHWEDGVLIVEVPVFGKTESRSGVSVQAVERTARLRLDEGSVLTLDPLSGKARLHDPSDAASALAAAEALRAYDGLRSGPALLQWWESQRALSPRAGVLLISGLARRLAAGEARVEDFQAIRRAVMRDANDAARRSLKETELGTLSDEARRCERDLGDLLDAVRLAATPEALERDLLNARARRDGLAALARALERRGLAGAAESLWRRIRTAAADRGRKLAGQPARDALAAAAAAVDAAVPSRVVISTNSYSRFIEDNRAGPRLAEILEDASLTLRRRSERIRSLLLGQALKNSDLGRELLSGLPASEAYSVIGAYEAFASVPQAQVLDRVQDAWAAAFNPSPLGVRQRAGLREPDSSVAVTALPAAEVTGSVLSRDPAGGLRAMVVSANNAQGGDEYLLDRRTGRLLAPPLLANKRLLSSANLASLVRAAAMIDDHFGRGMRLDFAISNGKLWLLGVRLDKLESSL